MRFLRPSAVLALIAAALLAGCGTKTVIVQAPDVTVGVKSNAPNAAEKLGTPALATKNTTRIAGADPIADAAGVARAVFPSTGGRETHPDAVTLAPTDDWQAALASAVMMASPIRAPILLSGSSHLPAVTSETLGVLAPTGAVGANGVQVIRVGDV